MTMFVHIIDAKRCANMYLGDSKLEQLLRFRLMLWFTNTIHIKLLCSFILLFRLVSTSLHLRSLGGRGGIERMMLHGVRRWEWGMMFT